MDKTPKCIHCDKPKYSFFGNLKSRSEPYYSVYSYRCPQCGFLEFYTENVL
jgi:DNA-directed RNA polymerase subunit M/transcription elongation factor TFIIS